MHAIGVFVIDGEVIIDVAELRPSANLPAAHANRANRMAVAQRPVDHIEIMDVLFADVVAGEPGEVEPVADLPFDIAATGAVGVPEPTLVPVATGRGDLADGPVMDAAH